jgi:hypothetical protein
MAGQVRNTVRIGSLFVDKGKLGDFSKGPLLKELENY